MYLYTCITNGKKFYKIIILTLLTYNFESVQIAPRMHLGIRPKTSVTKQE